MIDGTDGRRWIKIGKSATGKEERKRGNERQSKQNKEKLTAKQTRTGNVREL